MRRESRGQGDRSRRDHQGAHINQGCNLHRPATERLNGKMRVDFGESPSPLKEVAKALLFEAIEKNGMMLDDEIKNWRVLVEAKAITLEGRLSTKGLRMLTDLIPIPTETVTLNQASPKPGETVLRRPGPSSTADSKAKTSKKYFQHVSLLIDSMRTDVRNAGSPKLARMMVDKAALEIDRLGVLNVDEELIAYGAGVSETFRNMRNLSRNASLDASYRQASMAGNQGLVRLWGILWRRNVPFPLHIGDAKTGDSSAQVEPDGDLHHARGKDGGDSQENDAEVPGRVLTRAGCRPRCHRQARGSKMRRMNTRGQDYGGTRSLARSRMTFMQKNETKPSKKSFARTERHETLRKSCCVVAGTAPHSWFAMGSAGSLVNCGSPGPRLINLVHESIGTFHELPAVPSSFRESSSWRIPTRRRDRYWSWISVLSMCSSLRAGCASGMLLRGSSVTTSRPSGFAS